MTETPVITPLRHPDRVRLRPALIFGSVGPAGAAAAVTCLLDLFLREAALGHCRRLTLLLREGDEVELRAEGVALRLDERQEDGLPGWEHRLCRIPLAPRGAADPTAEVCHRALFGPEYSPEPEPWFDLCCVQCASAHMHITSVAHGVASHLLFSGGESASPLRRKSSPGKTETVIRFRPDPEVFGEFRLPFESLRHYLTRQAAAIPGLVCTAEDRRGHTL